MPAIAPHIQKVTERELKPLIVELRASGKYEEFATYRRLVKKMGRSTMEAACRAVMRFCPQRFGEEPPLTQIFPDSVKRPKAVKVQADDGQPRVREAILWVAEHLSNPAPPRAPSRLAASMFEHYSQAENRAGFWKDQFPKVGARSEHAEPKDEQDDKVAGLIDKVLNEIEHALRTGS